MVTGDETGWMLDSSMRMHRTVSQRTFISASGRCWQFMSCSIHLSGSYGIIVVVVVAERAHRRCGKFSAIPAMQLPLRCLLSLSVFALVARAIHESEVGIVDWYTKLVGVPLSTSQLTKPVFHHDTVLTATSNNVLAALNATDGSIGLLGFVLRVPDRDLDSCSLEEYTRCPRRYHGVQNARRQCVATFAHECSFSDFMLGVYALSGPAGSMLRVYDVSTGHLIYEKRLQNPAEVKVHDQPTLGIALTLVRAEGGDRAIVLTNGDTVRCIHSSTGETAWEWQSEDQG